MPVMMRGPIVRQLWWEDLLYASYDERTYCTPVMMRGPIVRQLWWEDLLYASYDERTYYMPVMMRGPIVCQLWWEDLLYVSYDERTYCMPVMMRGPIVCQLWWEDLLYASYDERTYCMPVTRTKKQNNKQESFTNVVKRQYNHAVWNLPRNSSSRIFQATLEVSLYCHFTTLVKYASHTRSIFVLPLYYLSERFKPH